MNCPTCNANSKVIDSRGRTVGGEPQSYRRRKCTKGHRFSTIELVTLERAGGVKVVVDSVAEHLARVRVELDNVAGLMTDLGKMT